MCGCCPLLSVWFIAVPFLVCASNFSLPPPGNVEYTGLYRARWLWLQGVPAVDSILLAACNTRDAIWWLPFTSTIPGISTPPAAASVDVAGQTYVGYSTYVDTAHIPGHFNAACWTELVVIHILRSIHACFQQQVEGHTQVTRSGSES